MENVVTINDLVQQYGTEKQKKAKKLSSNQKNSILNKARKEHSIRENRNGTYTILSTYEFPRPANWDKMNSSLYQYIIPLILSRLIVEDSRTIKFTVGRWSSEIHMVNSNYRIMDSNHKDTDKYVDIFNLKDINDYFRRANDSINNYISNALKYLKATGAIIWSLRDYVVEEVISDKINIDYMGNIELKKRDKNIREATTEDLEWKAKCMERADNECKVTNDSDRFNNREWQNLYHEHLYERKIKAVYPVYEIQKVHSDRCKNLLDLYPVRTIDYLINKLTNEFKDLLVTNASNRYSNNEKLQSEYAAAEYKLIYSYLSDLAILPDAPDLSNDIKYLQCTYNIKGETIDVT